MLIKRGKYLGLAVGSVAFTLIVWLGLAKSESVLEFHGNRGIQIESIRAMPKLLDKNSVVEFKHNTFEIK